MAAVTSVQANEADILTWVRDYFAREYITEPDANADLKAAWRDNEHIARVAFTDYKRLKTAGERMRWEKEQQWINSVPLGTFAIDLFFPLLVAEFIEHREKLPESFNRWLVDSLRQLPERRSTPLVNPTSSSARLVGRRNQHRDSQIGRAVLGVVMRYQIRPTRNRAARDRPNAPESACSIVAKALRTLGFNLTEEAVEAIWNRIGGGQALAVLKSK